MGGPARLWMVLLATIGAVACAVGIADAGGPMPSLSSPYVIGSTSAIRLGPTARLRVAGRDSEYPELAMSTSGSYLVAYPDNEPFGPFGVLAGTTATDVISTEQTGLIGSIGGLSPVQPVVAGDGRLGIGWVVRRGLRRSPYAIFGLDLAEHASAAGSRWTVRQVLAPRAGYDPTSSSGGIAFDQSDRLLWDRTTRAGNVASLVLARQIAPGGAFRTETVLRAGHDASIQLSPIGIDGSDHPVIVWSLAAATSPTMAASTAMAITTTSSGALRHVQVLRPGCYIGQLAVAPLGWAAVALLCAHGRFGTQVWVSERAPGGQFGSAVLVSEPNANAGSASVTIAADGRIWVAWNRDVGTARHIDAYIVRTEVSSALPGQPFPAPAWTTTPYPTQLNSPQVLTSPAGGVVVARGDGFGRVVLQRLGAGGRLGPAIVLSPRYVRNQQFAIDARGRGVAIWDAHIGDSNIPEARRFTLL